LLVEEDEEVTLETPLVGRRLAVDAARLHRVRGAQKAAQKANERLPLPFGPERVVVCDSSEDLGDTLVEMLGLGEERRWRIVSRPEPELPLTNPPFVGRPLSR